MAQPRIAVVGGGIAGTLCSLVLRNRGLQPTLIDAGRKGVGGRLRNNGAQFLRAADPRLATVVGMLERQGLMAEWKGRFGMLGSSGGGFLPAEVVSQNMGLSRRMEEKNQQEQQSASSTQNNPASDGGDFCGLVEGSHVPAYVGIPSMTELCPQISRLAGIEEVTDARLVGMTPLREGGWNLEVVCNGDFVIDPYEKFDALVLATHDSSLASRAIRSIMDAEVQAGGYDGLEQAINSKDDSALVIGRLGQIADSLQRVRDQDRVPVFAVSLKFPDGFSKEIPFDAVSVPASQTVQLMVREASKPPYGAAGVVEADGEWWTAVTTSRLASLILEEPELTDDMKLKQVAKVVTDEVMSLVSRYCSGHPPEPIELYPKRWSSAFCSQGLQLQEDSIFLAPWRLTVCGDFIRNTSAYSSPLEAAALSGLEAGERTAALWTQQEQ